MAPPSCPGHPDRPATWRCVACAAEHCADCVARTDVRGVPFEALGALLLPINLLAGALSMTLEDMEPRRTIPAALRTLPDYLPAVAVAAALLAGWQWGGQLAARLPAGDVVQGAALLYLIVLLAHLAGLLHLCCADRLDWS